MKQYIFKIDITSTGFGIVTAENKEEALAKLFDHNWDSILAKYPDSYGNARLVDDGEEIDDED